MATNNPPQCPPSPTAVMAMNSPNIHIPNCLLIGILYQLPIKLLFQFKCVSKTWFSLISDPSFFQNYPCHSNKQNGFPPWFHLARFVNFHGGDQLPQPIKGKHFVISENPLLHYSIPYPPPKIFRCVASSRDLLLLLGWYRRYYVCNPITDQCIRLPLLLAPNRRYYQLGIGFSSRVIAGVAHYKVVRIGVARKKVLRIDIFSSEIGEWRVKEMENPLDVDYCCFRKSVSIRGIIHWMDPEYPRIVAYCTETSSDELRLIDMPRGTESARTSVLNVVLDVWQGRLRYFELDGKILGPGKMPDWSVWVLVDYDKGEWCLEHRGYNRDISSLDAYHPILFLQRAIVPIGFHPLNMDLMYFWCKNHIFKYNLRSGLFEGVYHEEFSNTSMYPLYWSGVFSVFPSPLPTPIALPSWETEGEKGCTRKLLKRIFACWWP